MTDMQEFCLRWNNHQSNLVSAFYDLKLGEDFVDVTLACEGRCLQAHKVVLSACSPFFRDILKATPCKHPVIVLNDILFSDLVSLIEFIYMGEVRVKHQGLSSFLNTAEILRVRGLTEAASKQIKNSLLTSISENNNVGTTAPPRVPNNNLNNNNHSFSPTSFSQSYDTLQVPSSRCSPPESPGIHIDRSLPIDVKVEEIDLDSVDEDDDVDEENGMQEAQPQEESGSSTQIHQLGENSAHLSYPCSTGGPLTLQSFARIPVLADINQHSTDFPLLLITHDTPVEPGVSPGLDSDAANARTPGRLSSSDRPRWPCPFCMRLLSSRSSVRRHIEDRHTNDTSRHPCPLCERLYRTRNSLQYHLSTAHRDREPGPRGRPRTRPRTPSAAPTATAVSTAESVVLPIENMDNNDKHGIPFITEPDSGSSRSDMNSSGPNFGTNRRSPPFGLPPS